MWDHRSPGRARVFGHRGAMGYAPENTFASFALAVEQGVDAIELDVHLTADDEPVVIHDHHLERTTSIVRSTRLSIGASSAPPGPSTGRRARLFPSRADRVAGAEG